MTTIAKLLLATSIAAASLTTVTAHAADQKMAASAASDMSTGEVRKVDKDTHKITLKHGDIKNLDMPGMTMVFQVKDPAMLDRVQAGDKVKFRAEKTSSALVVTELEVTK